MATVAAYPQEAVLEAAALEVVLELPLDIRRQDRTLRRPDGRGRGLISARRSNAGHLARYLGNENIGELEYADGFARLEHEVSERTRVSIHALISRDAVVATQAGNIQRAEASYRNVHVWGVLDHHWSDGAHSRVIASYTDLQIGGAANKLGRASTRRACAMSACSRSRAFAWKTPSIPS